MPANRPLSKTRSQTLNLAWSQPAQDWETQLCRGWRPAAGRPGSHRQMVACYLASVISGKIETAGRGGLHASAGHPHCHVEWRDLRRQAGQHWLRGGWQETRIWWSSKAILPSESLISRIRKSSSRMGLDTTRRNCFDRSPAGTGSTSRAGNSHASSAPRSTPAPRH